MTDQHSYGWTPDLPDDRDHNLTITSPIGLPAQVDLRELMPPVYDQGQLGSCTANAIAAAFDVDRKIAGLSFISPSRLFIYWNERVIEGTTDEDAGAQIRDGIKTLKTLGAAPEKNWKYDIAKFADEPPARVFKAATKHHALAYARVPRVQTSIQQVLAVGHPVVIGFTVYESFESEDVATTGIMPMPSPGEQTLGGHAVLVVGYKLINNELHWIVRNSWGADWGDAGYFYMPASYLTKRGLSADFWVVQTINAGVAESRLGMR